MPAVLDQTTRTATAPTRASVLKEVTKDHSLVAEQVRMGLLDPAAARTHPMRNIVTRAVSGEDHLAIDVVEFDVEAEDTFLLCSDGLNSMLEDNAIRQCLLDALPDTTKSCQMLVQAANEAGGKDNINVHVLHIPN